MIPCLGGLPKKGMEFVSSTQIVRPTCGEKILLFLSRAPGSADYTAEHVKYTMENALALVCRVFPGFLAMIRGKDILDYGCGGRISGGRAG